MQMPAMLYSGRVILAAVLLGLAACSSGPTPVSRGAPEATVPAAGTATPPVTPRPAAPAAPAPVDRLLDEAAQACAAGDISAALGRLDRALRIDPRRADLYLEMARCYASVGDGGRASAAAERGLSYCRGDECRRLRRFLDS